MLNKTKKYEKCIFLSPKSLNIDIVFFCSNWIFHENTIIYALSTIEPHENPKRKHIFSVTYDVHMLILNLFVNANDIHESSAYR